MALMQVVRQVSIQRLLAISLSPSICWGLGILKKREFFCF